MIQFRKDDDGDSFLIYGPRIFPPETNVNNRKISMPNGLPQIMEKSCNDGELKAARFMLYFSLSVLFCKIYIGHRAMFDSWGLTAWQVAVDLQWILLPLVWSLIITYITWVITYYDSAVPGIQPPSPFSAANTSGRRWHSCYIAVVASGILCFIILLFFYW